MSKKQRTKKDIIFYIAAAVIIIVFSIIIIVSVIDSRKNNKINNELAEDHYSVVTPAPETEITTTAPTETETTQTETEPPPLVVMSNMEKPLAENPDTAGWISVGGTLIDNIVVQAEDNNYYLDRNFYGEKSQPGTIYADFRCKVNTYSNKQSDNIILYGHNQADGSMFGTLNRYKVKSGYTKNFDFYLKNPTFTFSNLYEEYTYKIVAAFIIEVEPRHTRDGVIFDYHNFVKFTSEGPYTYENFINGIMERTAINTGVDVQEGDKFMTLSTCSNEFEPSRFVVIGRRVRDGESPEVDTSKASINEDAKEPDINFIYNQ